MRATVLRVDDGNGHVAFTFFAINQCSLELLRFYGLQQLQDVVGGVQVAW